MSRRKSAYIQELERELHRLETVEADRRRQVLDIVLRNCVIHPRGKIGLNVIYEMVAREMGRANSPKFKLWVAEILLTELGVYRVGADLKPENWACDSCTC